MAISKHLILLLALSCAAAAHSREVASTAECELAASTPPIAGAKAAVAAAPGELRAQFRLADAWSEAGCFSKALQVLSEADRQHPGDHELQTRLRVARSVVGEEKFFDNLDRAEDQARAKRNTFRCTSLQDVAACAEVVRATPGDASALVAQGDALSKAGHASEALLSYRRAASLAPDLVLGDKIAALQTHSQALVSDATSNAMPSVSTTPPPARSKPAVRVAQAVTPVVRYSNQETESRSH